MKKPGDKPNWGHPELDQLGSTLDLVDSKIKDYQTSPLYVGLIGKTMAARTRRQSAALRARYLELLTEEGT